MAAKLIPEAKIFLLALEELVENGNLNFRKSESHIKITGVKRRRSRHLGGNVEIFAVATVEMPSKLISGRGARQSLELKSDGDSHSGHVEG